MTGRALVLACLLALALAAPAQADFGLHTFDVSFEEEDGTPATKAGSHPYAMTTRFALNYHGTGESAKPDGELKDGEFDLPVGFAGNPTATPTCSRAAFLEFDSEGLTQCPAASAVGVASLAALHPDAALPAPVYNLQPPPGVAAEFGFLVLRQAATVDVVVKKGKPYNVTALSINTPQTVEFFGAKLTVWGDPANPVHDGERGRCAVFGGSCPVGPGVAEKPFLTLPRACAPPLYASYRATSWQRPEDPPVQGTSATPLQLSECEGLDFGPTIDAKPTAGTAESPTGLDFDLDVDAPGLSEPEGTADADIKKAVVTLPEGLTTNPAVASGLGACSQAQFESETVDSEPGTGCPESAKVGSVQVETPLLEGKVLTGSIYVAKQGDNEFGNLLTIDMVIKEPQLGILVRAAGRVDPDPATGRLTTTFDDLPQLPFSHFHLHFRDGQRAPLITPPTCGEFQTNVELYSYAKPEVALSRSSAFSIDSGADGAGCSSQAAQLPNRSRLQAGTLDPKAGGFSPFVFDLSREDGTQQLSSISATLPDGLTGRLAGIPYCPEAGIAQARSRAGEGMGAVELALPSCPSASRLGTVTVGAGADPYHVTGQAYLGGPYEGAPLSMVIVTPAIAGPFDLGAVTVRTALRVDPETAKITAVSDPIPSILHGLPLVVRSVVLSLDRADFMLNPTSCEPKSIEASATSTLGQQTGLSQYFQAADCSQLKYTPKLSLRLKGGAKRTDNPALLATASFPQGSYANTARVQVALPHSEFLEQGHIGTICTRVQFAAEACPKGSVYGRATATTPLLDEPLSGPVYLRSSDNPLPDLVADLRGQVHVALVGRIDTVRGGIRTTFAATPDVPVKSFTLAMRGGAKGLLVNSTDICRETHKASARFVAQNGRSVDLRPAIKVKCAEHGRRHRGGAGHPHR